MFRIILAHPRHPARRLDRRRRHIMVRIFLIVSPRVVADNRIDLQKTEQKNQPRPQFQGRHRVQHVIAIVQVVNFLQPERLRDGLIVALIRQHSFADRPRPGVIVVGGANQIAGVSFLDQLQHKTSGENRKIVGVRLNRRQHFSRMKLARLYFLDVYFGGRKRPFVGRRAGRGSGECASGDVLEKLAAVHWITPSHDSDSSAHD